MTEHKDAKEPLKDADSNKYIDTSGRTSPAKTNKYGRDSIVKTVSTSWGSNELFSKKEAFKKLQDRFIIDKVHWLSPSQLKEMGFLKEMQVNIDILID